MKRPWNLEQSSLLHIYQRVLLSAGSLRDIDGLLPHPDLLRSSAPRSRCTLVRFPRAAPSVRSRCWWLDQSPAGSSRNPAALRRDRKQEVSVWIQLLSSRRLLLSGTVFWLRPSFIQLRPRLQSHFICFKS